MELRELLDQADITPQKIGAHLDKLAPEERKRQATSLKRGQLKKLWDMSAKTAPVEIDDFVPQGHKPLAPVPFDGQNSLPLFRSFQKVFYRTADGRIAGYNNSPVGWLVGPGYYIVNKNGKGTFIDYTQTPQDKPEGWPAIKKNESGISTFVYGHMHDYMRRVAGDFMIGRAIRKGKETPNYFVLIR
jgi:hypothetical protein